MQGEAGLLPQVHPVPTQAAGIEAVEQLRDLSGQFLRVLCLQRQRVAQQHGAAPVEMGQQNEPLGSILP